jgi:hypothetical protein
MNKNITEELVWQRACGGGACAEVAYSEGHTHIRNSAEPQNIVTFTTDEWRRLVADIHSGAIA